MIDFFVLMCFMVRRDDFLVLWMCVWMLFRFGWLFVLIWWCVGMCLLCLVYKCWNIGVFLRVCFWRWRCGVVIFGICGLLFIFVVWYFFVVMRVIRIGFIVRIRY